MNLRLFLALLLPVHTLLGTRIRHKPLRMFLLLFHACALLSLALTDLIAALRGDAEEEAEA